MNNVFRAYISVLRLMTDNFLFEFGGKLAALWFDEIILPVRNEAIISVMGMVAEDQHWNRTTFKEVSQIWVPVTKYQPEYKFLSNPWQAEHPSLIEIAERITIAETKKESPGFQEDHPLFRHEAAWAGAGLIEAVNLWLALRIKMQCSFLPQSREHLVLQELFKAEAKKRTSYDIFTEVMLNEMPDLDSSSWDEIIDLRHHTFFEAFRKKMVELNQLIDSDNSRSVKELIDEISRKDMEKMIRSLRPSPRKMILKTIVSNLPTPLPVNPVSILLSAEDVRRELELSRKYGWLYFLLDLQKPH